MRRKVYRIKYSSDRCIFDDKWNTRMTVLRSESGITWKICRGCERMLKNFWNKE